MKPLVGRGYQAVSIGKPSGTCERKTHKSPKRLELVEMEEALKAGHVVDSAREMQVSDMSIFDVVGLFAVQLESQRRVLENKQSHIEERSMAGVVYRADLRSE